MDLVPIDIPSKLYDRLAERAARLECCPDEILEDMIAAAMTPPAPTHKKAMLRCDRCGPTVHRWSRTALIGNGQFTHVYGCTRCYRRNDYGTAELPGWAAVKAKETATRSKPPKSPAKPVAKRQIEVLVRVLKPGLKKLEPGSTVEEMWSMLATTPVPGPGLYPGVPEAMQ